MIDPNLFEPLDLGVIVGGKRCFKTLHGVHMAKVAHDNGYSVFANSTLRDHEGKDWRCEMGRLSKTDPNEFLNQLQKLVDYIDAQGLQREPKFLLIDEFKSIAHSQRWKEVAWTTDLWTQLSKVGFTTYATNQTFSMTYNSYREIADKQVVTQKVSKNEYIAMVYKQNSSNHESYSLFGAYYNKDASATYPLYDTFELMYGRKKR